MRIGVTLDSAKGLEGDVCMHFGQCSHFLIVDIDNGKIAGTKVIPNAAQHGGGGCVAVDEILKHKVTHVIAGGMGVGAQQKFATAAVKIFGYTGKGEEEGLEMLLKNSLGSIEACREHDECH